MCLIHSEISQLSAPREQVGPRNQLTIRRHAQLNNSTCWTVSMFRRLVCSEDKVAYKENSNRRWRQIVRFLRILICECSPPLWHAFYMESILFQGAIGEWGYSLECALFPNRKPSAEVHHRPTPRCLRGVYSWRFELNSSSGETQNSTDGSGFFLAFLLKTCSLWYVLQFHCKKKTKKKQTFTTLQKYWKAFFFKYKNVLEQSDWRALFLLFIYIFSKHKT